MSDVKISQLPVATTPVDGTEVLPIVQSATTKQVSIANLTAGRAMSASSLTLTTPLAVTSGGTGLATTAAGTLLSSTALNTISATATPTLGVAGTTAGTLGLSGSTSGVVTLATAATAGTWTFTLPTSGGTNGFILTTNGSGVTSWTNPTALGVDLDVGSTAITGGTTGRVLYNNAGVLGEYAVTGTGSVVLGTTPTFTTSALFPAGTVGAPGISVSGDTNTGIYFPAADTIGFVEGGVESMRLDASGNLGLGVTPSAWGTGSSLRAIELNAGSVASFSTTALLFLQNAYLDGTNYIYKTTAAATRYTQLTGSHLWHIAPSGTAGNAISFTQAMTLDASGNLGVGTTGPIVRLHTAINSSSTNNAFLGNQNTALLLQNTSNTAGNGTYLANSFSTGAINAYIGFVNVDQNYASAITFGTAVSGASNYGERMRIDASGNLLVGTTSGGGISDGGATNPGVGLERVGTITAQRNNDANMFLSKASGYTNGDLINFYVNNSRKGVISTDGTNTTYGTSSDISLKENISDAASALASILTMPIRQFDWKVGGHTDYGVVAQEADGYAPEIVTKGDIWAVDYGRITPRLIKAFQELAAEVAMLKGQING